MGYQSVAEMLRIRVQKTPDLEAFSFPTSNGTWDSINWQQTWDRSELIAGGIRSLGVDDENRVAILCGTRVEWILVDLGNMLSAAATTTIYPSTTAEDSQYIIENSDSVLVFVENDEQAEKISSVRESLPNVMHLINIDGKGSDDGWIITLAELEEKGKSWLEENDINEIIDRITPDKLATLIYTSGTTGKPKGVELLHDCWIFTAEGLEDIDILTSEDKQFLWLPLSHSFGKVLEVIIIHLGIPTAVDGDVTKIIDNLAVVKPTFMGAAPRIFEKAYNKIVNGAKDAGGAKYKIFQFAVKTGREVSQLRQQGKKPAGLLALKFSIADKLVYSKIRARFGGRIRFFISGSAPLNREIAEFFDAAGLLILEGYGLTESSAASFVGVPDTNKFGTVGRPLKGTEVRIDPDTGEIQFKSRGVMRGYYKRPDVTAETLTDGWLNTGDKGEIDEMGRLKITDRIKNLIKTSGGKYVAPAQLEGAFKALCPLVSQILVHGNNRNFCTAIITLDEDGAKMWANQNELGSLSYAEISQHPKMRDEMKGYIDQLNKPLARYETIKEFAILEADFDVTTGELTPSMKVKRKVVETKHKDLLDKFYTDALASV